MIEIDKVPVEKTGGVGQMTFEGGTASMTRLLDGTPGGRELRAVIVTFPPGVRTKMHVHDHEQILYILSGRGIVATDEEERVATPGMIFSIAAGERHSHGATKDSSFSHLYVFNKATKSTT